MSERIGSQVAQQRAHENKDSADYKQLQMERQKLKDAYKRVFGEPPERMNEAQKMVWADLCARSRIDETTVTRNPVSGEVDQVATIGYEYMRSLMLYIKRMIKDNQ